MILNDNDRTQCETLTLTRNDEEILIDNEERSKCEIYQKIMGYCKDIGGANIGKRQEFKDRKSFSEEKAMI